MLFPSHYSVPARARPPRSRSTAAGGRKGGANASGPVPPRNRRARGARPPPPGHKKNGGLCQTRRFNQPHHPAATYPSRGTPPHHRKGTGRHTCRRGKPLRPSGHKKAADASCPAVSVDLLLFRRRHTVPQPRRRRKGPPTDTENRSVPPGTKKAAGPFGVRRPVHMHLPASRRKPSTTARLRGLPPEYDRSTRR